MVLDGPAIIAWSTVPYTICACLVYRHLDFSWGAAIPMAVGTTVATVTALAAAVMLIPPSAFSE
jgi:hypothetical protein